MHGIITSLVIAVLLVGNAFAQPQASSKKGAQQTRNKNQVRGQIKDGKQGEPAKQIKTDKPKKQAVQNATVKPPAVNAKAVPPAPVPTKRVRELFQFVDENHRALRPLLKTLERRDQNKFQAAMRSLDREVNSLQNQKKNSPNRYERSLKIWVLRSQAKLVAAKIVTNKSEKTKAKLEKELENLVNQQIDLRQNQLASDLEAYENRIARIKKQQAELKSKRSQMVERQIDALVRSVKGMTRNKKKPKTDKSKKPQPKEPGKKTPKKSIGE